MGVVHRALVLSSEIILKLPQAFQIILIFFTIFTPEMIFILLFRIHCSFAWIPNHTCAWDWRRQFWRPP